jgi:hypothetical protein
MRREETFLMFFYLFVHREKIELFGGDGGKYDYIQ